MTNATTFTSYWGNALQGINITWSLDTALASTITPASIPGAAEKLKI